MQVPPFVAKVWPIVASAALFSLAYAPANLSLLVFVALVPWLESLRHTNGGGAVRSGLTFGVLFWLFQMNWLVPFVEKWTGSFGLALLPWLAVPIVCAWYFALLAWFIHKAWRLGLWWFIPLLWAGLEFARAYMPTLAFPWGLLATPLWRIPMVVQHAALGSIFLVSAWVCLVNVAFVCVLYSNKKLTAVRMAIVAIVIAGVSWVRYVYPPQGVQKTITLGQVGVDLAFGDKEHREADLNFAMATILARAMAQGSNLVIFPEGVCLGDDQSPPYSSIGPQPPVAVMMGGKRGSTPPYQSTFAYDGKWKFVDKTRLVVFGEFVPFRSLLGGLEGFRLPNGDLRSGDKIDILEVAGIKIGPELCFEALFPNIAAKQSALGAQMLAIMVIDDWYVGTTATDQLEAAAVWRAIETGLPVARVGSLGKTFVVDPVGNVTYRAPFGEPFALRAELTIPTGGTQNWGWLFGWICVAAGTWVVAKSVSDKGKNF